ncbi:MAG: hypothetical protein ACYC5K_12230, partial [Saccharofermentanales bacterium]
VSAGTYTVTVTMGGSFSAPAVTVTNSAGGSITGNAYRLTSSVLNVTSITGIIRMNTLASGTSINMTVFYSTNGTNFYAGTTVNCPLNTQVRYTINFGTSTKTIVALFFMPSTATWPSYNYSVWTPSFTRLLTDTTAPTISLSASTVYATTNIVTATVTDSQSGVSVKKWASGIQTASYFASGGTVLTGSSFTVSANGYYTVYAIDVAGNSAVQTVIVSYIDNFISITHPLTITYSITPNSATPFMSPDITITNNSRIKVYVSVTSLEAITGGSLVFTDVPVTLFSNWSAISKLQSKQYIALGIKIKETAVAPDSWSNIYTTSTYYALNIISKIYFGLLNPNGATGNFSIVASHGLAFDNAYTSKHQLNFVFDAY